MNKVFLIGRLTKDPETRKFENSSSNQFTLAIDRTFKNKDGNKEADFIPCVAWNKTAELIQKYVSKGDMIAITGRIQTRNYEVNNERRYVTEVIVEEIQFINTKSKEKSNEQTQFDGFDEIEDLDVPF